MVTCEDDERDAGCSAMFHQYQKLDPICFAQIKTLISRSISFNNTFYVGTAYEKHQKVSNKNWKQMLNLLNQSI